MGGRPVNQHRRRRRRGLRTKECAAPRPSTVYVSVHSSAIEELYRRRYPSFRRALATVTGDFESAHDAVQDGFARAIARRESFRGSGSLEGWVWRICLRAAYDVRRAQGFSAEGVEEAIGLVEPESDPDLDAAIRSLPPRQRLMVFLHYFGDLSQEDVAVVTGTRPGTVAAALAQARATLEARLVEGRQR